MSNFKLVPLEPTAEMIEAAEDAYMPFGDMDLAIRMATLAAPDVQGEPCVETLVEALTELCDEIDKHGIHDAVSETSILWFKRKAREALAAHRGESSRDNQ